MEEAKEIKTDIITAGAIPDIRQIDDTLVLFFIDSANKKVTVVFNDVIAFKWEGFQNKIEGEIKDCCYEINNSEWIDLHKNLNTELELDQHKHYKFNFSSHGHFEILASYYLIRTSE